MDESTSVVLRYLVAEVLRRNNLAAYLSSFLALAMAFFSLLQSWSAASGAKASHAQAKALRQQTELLIEQVTLERGSYMEAQTPEFIIHPAQFSELGTVDHSSNLSATFRPLDEVARRNPATWIRRRTFELECIKSPGTILVALKYSPSEVKQFREIENTFVAGGRRRVTLIYPVDIDESKIYVELRSHIASEPGHTWVTKLSCFAG